MIQLRTGLFYLVIFVTLWSIFPASFALRDPTQPALTTADLGDGSDLVVMMIMVGKGYATANVNGKMVKVGDKINDAKVVVIEPNAVTFYTAEKGKFSVPLHRVVVKENIYNPSEVATSGKHVKNGSHLARKMMDNGWQQ